MNIKMMIVLIFLLSNLMANDKNISLLDFAQRVSNQTDLNIYIDENINDKKISLLVPDDVKGRDLFLLFKSSIEKLNFKLKKIGDVYYLTKKRKVKSNSYIYKLKYNSFDNVKLVLEQLQVKYKYLDNINSLLLHTTKENYSMVQSIIDSIDVMQKQVKLKIMIFEYSDLDLKEAGFKYGTSYQQLDGTIKNSMDLLVAPLSTKGLSLSSTNFYLALRMLKENELINVKQFPYILAKNNKKFEFTAVENIPYLEKTTTTEASNVSEENSIVYKDVGLKILGKSLIYKDYIALDIDLTVEDLVNQSENTNTPKTYKRQLKSNTNIKYNEVLILSGLKRNRHTINNIEVPILSGIPFLGNMFKYKYANDENLNITIAIEVLRENL